MSNLFFYLIIFLFGLIVGSFLNCLIYRLEKKESFLKGRSYCPRCKHQLSWQDLIPLLSFLELGGKCRYCKQKISWQYPLVEISTALIFLLVFIFQSSIFNEFLIINFLTLIYYWIIAVFLIIIFVYDLKYYIIPDEIIYPAIVIALIFNFKFLIFGQAPIFKLSILSALGASAFFLAIFLVSRGKWLGFGDVKLAAFMGLFLGFPNILVGLFLAFFIGAIIGSVLILTNKKKLKSEVPFGPFLVTGTLISLFWGRELVSWYLNFFHLS